MSEQQRDLPGFWQSAGSEKNNRFCGPTIGRWIQVKRKSLVILFLVSLCFLLSACGGETAQSCPMNPRGGLSWPIEPVQKLTILEQSRSYYWAPVYLAQTLGYYEDEGLEVTFQPMIESDSEEDALVLSDLITAMETDEQRVILTVTQQGSTRWLQNLPLSDFEIIPESIQNETFHVTASSDLIQSDPELIQKASNAFVRAMEWMEESDPEEIAEALAPLFPGEEDLLMDVATLDKQHRITNTSGRHSGKGYRQAVAAAKETGFDGNIPSEGELYEESFLNHARDLLNASQLCRKHGAA